MNKMRVIREGNKIEDRQERWSFITINARKRNNST
jgi:hypothetical protein